jgi:hypothetical protein
MSEPPRRLIEVGTFPSGYAHTFVDGADPLVIALEAAHAKLDAEAREAERIRLAQIADIERVKNTRRARAAKRLRQALKLWRR